MIYRIGNIALTIDIDTLDQKTLEVLQKITHAEVIGQQAQPAQPASFDLPAADNSSDLGVLKKVGFTVRTLTNIANRLLGFNVTSAHIEKNFDQMKSKAHEWLKTKIEEPIWALYLPKVAVPKLGVKIFAVGLNDSNQQVVLGLYDSMEDLLRDLKSREFKVKALELGIIPPDEQLKKSFAKAFPKADIAFDWQEFLDQAKGKERDEIHQAMLEVNTRLVTKFVKEKGLPKELLTYQKYDKKLWRAIRKITAKERIERELRSRTKYSWISTPKLLGLVTTWTLLRLQYQWLRIPVDSDTLSNLKHLKLRLAEK